MAGSPAHRPGQDEMVTTQADVDRTEERLTRIAERPAQLGLTRRELRTAVDQVQPDLRATRPGADRWSVAEILEHLNTVERRITALVAKEAAAIRAQGAVETDAAS